MRIITRHPKGVLAGSVGTLTVAAAVVMATLSSGASATTGTAVRHQHARPEMGARAAATATKFPTKAFTQTFGTNDSQFCNGAVPPNPPCDGSSPNNYGTIDRVLSNYSNGGAGNYAPSTKALTGNWMAVVDGAGDGNQSAVNLNAGCPGTTATSNPGENCSGPYSLFGTGAGTGGLNEFPAGGFTVTADIYLSPSTAGPLGSLVDSDVSLNNTAGSYFSDDIITNCYESGATTGFVTNFFGGSAGSCAGTPDITTDGWYREVWQFSNQGGKAFVTESVYKEAAGTPLVVTSGPQPASGTATSVSQVGGPGYFWLPTEDFDGLPLGQLALQLGQHAKGHAA